MPAPRGKRAVEDQADHALRALAEPRRRAILRLVAHDELPAGEVAAAFDITRTAVSQHLTVLKEAGLLSERRDGTRRLYRARPEGLGGLREFLDDLWAGALDTARRLVEAEQGVDDDRRATAG
ncbi:MAG: metalloregulator ArsR/SmtB family transcription factor [Actinomycetota bacterium]|nr:metalloregulator ArsR/SmtB family transcription factor [Actinomycetota bacterium]